MTTFGILQQPLIETHLAHICTYVF